jgi:recombination protein RecA
MLLAATIRLQVESALTNKVPSALSPPPRIIRPTQATGIESLDRLLEGGLPAGAITEIVGRECSSRTSLAFSLCAQVTQSARVCVWIDVTDTFHPESAAAVGIDLKRLLWVRCGIVRPNTSELSSSLSVALPPKYFVPPSIKRGLHGGSFGPHPRTEVKSMSDAVGSFLKPPAIAPRCAEPQRREPIQLHRFVPDPLPHPNRPKRIGRQGRPLTRIEESLRVADLILQGGGGFSAIVLDMGSVAPEHASRVPLATWFRYRAAAERTQTSFLLLSQHACTGSSAGLVLRLQDGNPARDETMVFTGLKHRVELTRERFAPSSGNVIPLRRPPQSEKTASWQSHVTWAGYR